MSQSDSPRRSTRRAWPSLDLPPVVLLVDNQHNIRDLLREILEADGFRTLTAPDGYEGLKLAELSMPDVLVTDVAMPRIDGFGLTRALRQLYPDLPVIVMSGDPFYQGRALEEVAAEHGVAATLLKPFDLTVLQEAVRKAVPAIAASTVETDLDGGAGRAA
jgi:two-component system chemotaxis response regulator CheY